MSSHSIVLEYVQQDTIGNILLYVWLQRYELSFCVQYLVAPKVGRRVVARQEIYFKTLYEYIVQSWYVFNDVCTKCVVSLFASYGNRSVYVVNGLLVWQEKMPFMEARHLFIVLFCVIFSLKTACNKPRKHLKYHEQHYKSIVFLKLIQYFYAKLFDGNILVKILFSDCCRRKNNKKVHTNMDINDPSVAVVEESAAATTLPVASLSWEEIEQLKAQATAGDSSLLVEAILRGSIILIPKDDAETAVRNQQDLLHILSVHQLFVKTIRKALLQPELIRPYLINDESGVSINAGKIAKELLGVDMSGGTVGVLRQLPSLFAQFKKMNKSGVAEFYERSEIKPVLERLYTDKYLKQADLPQLLHRYVDICYNRNVLPDETFHFLQTLGFLDEAQVNVILQSKTKEQ